MVARSFWYFNLELNVSLVPNLSFFIFIFLDLSIILTTNKRLLINRHNLCVCIYIYGQLELGGFIGDTSFYNSFSESLI